MNFSICIFKRFFGDFLATAILRNVLLNSCFWFYSMTLSIRIFLWLLSEEYSKYSQTSRIEPFAEIVTGFKASNSFAKIFILYICLVFQFTSEYFVNTSDRLPIAARLSKGNLQRGYTRFTSTVGHRPSIALPSNSEEQCMV